MPVGADGFRLPNANENQAKNKLEWITGPGQDEYCRTFVINEEDHTLGNALKHVLMQHGGGVWIYCATSNGAEYSCASTNSGMPAVQALYQALTTLKKQNQQVKKMLQDEVKRHTEDHPPEDAEMDTQ